MKPKVKPPTTKKRKYTKQTIKYDDLHETCINTRNDLLIRLQSRMSELREKTLELQNQTVKSRNLEAFVNELCLEMSNFVHASAGMIPYLNQFDSNFYKFIETKKKVNELLKKVEQT